MFCMSVNRTDSRFWTKDIVKNNSLWFFLGTPTSEEPVDSRHTVGDKSTRTISEPSKSIQVQNVLSEPILSVCHLLRFANFACWCCVALPVDTLMMGVEFGNKRAFTHSRFSWNPLDNFSSVGSGASSSKNSKRMTSGVRKVLSQMQDRGRLGVTGPST